MDTLKHFFRRLAIAVCWLFPLLAAFSASAVPDIERYQFTSRWPQSLVGPWTNDMSGCCLMPSTGELLVILNKTANDGPPAIQVYGLDGTYQRYIGLQGFEDTEGICLYDPNSNLFAIVEEGLNDITVVSIVSGTRSVAKSSGRTIHMGLTLDPRYGIEGITYSPHAKCFYAVREKSPMTLYRVSDTAIPVSVNVIAQEAAFRPHCTDLSDLVFDPSSGHLFVLSDESARVIECDLTGNVLGDLLLPMGQPEGITVSAGSDAMYFVGEPKRPRR